MVGSVLIAEQTKVFRAETLEEYLKAGVEVWKVNEMRPWLERRCGHTLTRSDHLMESFLPPLKLKHMNKIRAEAKDQLVGVCTDGTTHEGEAFAVTLRWMTDNVDFKRRALRIHFLEASMDNEAISSLLVTTVARDGQIPLANVLDIQNDSCSPNIKSYMETTSLMLPYSDMDPCLPHTGGNTGQCFETPTLSELVQAYTQAVGHSKPTRVVFREITGTTLQTKGSSIRWHVENDVIEHCIYPFLENGKLREWVQAMIDQGLCPQSCKKMDNLLASPTKFTLLWLEALVADKGAKKMKAGFTYLEGQTFEYVTGYPKVLEIRESLKSSGWLTADVKAEISRIAAQAPTSATNLPAPVTPTIVEHEDPQTESAS